MLYVLLSNAARPVTRMIEVEAIRVDPIIAFLSDCTASISFLLLSFSKNNDQSEDIYSCKVN